MLWYIVIHIHSTQMTLFDNYSLNFIMLFPLAEGEKKILPSLSIRTTSNKDTKLYM